MTPVEDDFKEKRITAGNAKNAEKELKEND
jgi:hypothetical protein